MPKSCEKQITFSFKIYGHNPKRALCLSFAKRLIACGRNLLSVAASRGLDVAFPLKFQKQRGKRQMVLRKRMGAVIGPEQEALCKQFAER